MSIAVDLPPAKESPLSEPQTRSFPWHRLLGAIGIALVVIGLVNSDESRINGLGLLSVPSLAYYPGIALILCWAVGELARPSRYATFWFILSLVAVVFSLHGLPGFVEANPRFSVAYNHVGFADAIATNGRLLPQVDARFSWAGFFAGGALLQRASGGGLLLWAVRFFPVVVTLLACAETITLGRILGISIRRCRFAALLFALLSWVGQDYFAPQAVGYLLYLTMICTVLLVFPGAGPDLEKSRLRWIRPRPLPQVEFSIGVQRAVLVGLILMTGVMVTAHQLTPGFLAIALVALGLFNATRLRALGWIAIAMTIGWLSYEAEAYWIGHVSNIFGSTGDVGALVKSNLGKRTNVGFDRQIVLMSRIGLSALFVLAVAAACVIMWRRHRVPMPLVVLSVAPIVLLSAQAYGGEMPLRVFFFMLPAGVLLIAEGFGSVGPWSWPRQAVTTAVAIAIVPLFLLSRFGNESFEYVPKQDRDVLMQLYAQAPAHTYVYVVNGITVKYLVRVNDVRFVQLNPGVSGTRIYKRMQGTKDRAGRFVPSQYVMVNHTQEESGVQQYGLRPGWTQRTVAELLATGHYKVVAREKDAVLLKFYPPAKASKK